MIEYHRHGGINMNIRNFMLSFYEKSLDGIHIQRVEKPREAKQPHTHRYYQIYYISKGSLTHYLNGEATQISAGDMFIIPPGIVHHIAENDGVVFYSLSFMPDVIEDIPHMSGIAADFIRELDEKKNINAKMSIPSNESLYIESLIKHIYEEFESGRPAGYEIIRLHIYTLLTLLARIYYDTNELMPQSGDRKHLVLCCVDHIENNYANNITLNEMIKLSTLSRSEFCRSFRSLTGHSFHQHLNICRIKKAAECIKRGDKITALYSFCGYEDHSTFYRNFTKIMGMSPAKYRAMCQSDSDK